MEYATTTALNSCENGTALIEPMKETASQIELESESKEQYFLMEQSEHHEHQSHQQDSKAANTEVICSVEDTEERPVWLNMCRICANINDHLIPIFYGEGVEHALCNKIHKYLPIHVTENDNLPLQLCFHCAATLLAWHELVEGCLEAEQRLMDMQTAPLEKQLYREMENKIGKPGKISQNIERSCSAQTPFKTLLDMQNTFWMKYRKMYLLQGTKDIPNGNCDTIWIAVMDSSLDQSSIACDQFKNNYLNEKQEFPEPYKQNDITNIVVKQEDVHNVVVKSNEKITKDIGNVELEFKDNLNSTENGTKIIKRMKIQKDLVEIQESYQCAECGKCFKLKDSYLRHMRIHRDERPFTCHVCGKQFRDSGGLSRHLKDVHAKLKNFTCDICGRSFASKATRDDHRRTHTGERPYICDSCGKTFKSKASLYIHSKLHTDEFPHPCSYCSKKFRRRQEMLAHVTTHTGEKNYECEICFKRFRVKSELVRHKLIHSENKPFVCISCGLAFRQKRYLNNHVKSRHVETFRTS